MIVTSTLKTAESILNKYAAPDSSLTELIQEIGNHLAALAPDVEICAFSDHQNGLSVLRLGKKPTKIEGTKQSFSLPMEWNGWAENNGIGKQVATARFIVTGEINPAAEEFLSAIREMSEDRNRKVTKVQNPAIWGNRDKIQIKWGIVAAGEKSRRLLSDIELFADSSKPVLITGETGCGKELVANALHTGARRKGRFFAINCAAIPKELIESELFGHKKGAYTGATDSREGYFQAANDGTLFLDEIGELSLDLQAKLLRVLQENKVRRVGSNIEEDVRVRVVAATNRNLAEMVKTGEFRADLFYRLHVLILKVAPLRERSEEIPQLVEYLLKKISEEENKPMTIDPSALRRLVKHDFPGNVRELVNLLEAGAVYAQSGVIGLEHLRINGEIEESIESASFESDFEELCPVNETFSVEENLIKFSQGKTYDQIQEAVSKVIFKNALDENDGQIARAAASLGMERSTLSRQLKKLGIINNHKEEDLMPLNLSIHHQGNTSSMSRTALAA